MGGKIFCDRCLTVVPPLTPRCARASFSAPRPRRTSAAASLVWQSLVKRNLHRRPRSQTTHGRLSRTVPTTGEGNIKMLTTVHLSKIPSREGRWSLSRPKRRASTHSVSVGSRKPRLSLLSRNEIPVTTVVESGVAATTPVTRRSRSSKCRNSTLHTRVNDGFFLTQAHRLIPSSTLLRTK